MNSAQNPDNNYGLDCYEPMDAKTNDGSDLTKNKQQT
jgi:hypothetical protein